MVFYQFNDVSFLYFPLSVFVILSKFTPLSDLQILAIFDGYYMN